MTLISSWTWLIKRNGNIFVEKKCSKTDNYFVEETGFDEKLKWVWVKMFVKVENLECRSASKISRRDNFSSSKNEVQEVILSIQEKSESQRNKNTVGIWNPTLLWLQRGWVANGLDFKWHLKSGCPTIWYSYKWLPLSQEPFAIQTKMSGYKVGWFLNGHGHSFNLAIGRPFKNWTIWNLIFKKPGFWMVIFQILSRVSIILIKRKIMAICQYCI